MALSKDQYGCFFDQSSDGSWNLRWDPQTRMFSVMFDRKWYEAPNHELVSDAPHLEVGETMTHHEADLKFIVQRLLQCAREGKLPDL